MAKRKPLTPEQKEYKKNRDRITRFIRENKKRGYIFAPYKEIFPEKTGNKQEDIEALRNITPEVLRESARYRSKSGRIYSGTEGKQIEQGKLTESNLSGREIYEEVERLKKEGNIKKLNAYYDSLSKEELSRYVRYRDEIIDDEISSSPADREIPKSEEREADYSEQDIQDDETEYDGKIPDYENKEYEPDQEKINEWKKRFREEKKKPKRERKFANDGEVVYAGMMDRISIFEREWDAADEKFRYAHYENNGAKNVLKNRINALINEIGFNGLCRRLDRHGFEIDSLLQSMLYDSERPGEQKVMSALLGILSILNGGVLTPEQTWEATTEAERLSGEDADEDEYGQYYDEDEEV